MFFAASLLTLLPLSITVSPVEVRSSHITLPMTRRLKFSNFTELLQHDEARVAAFGDYSMHGRRAHVPLTNFHWGYTVAVGIGVPLTIYNLIVDTGSSNTWVGAATTYVKTATSVDTEEPVFIDYRSAYFEGTIFKDTITFNDDLTITNMPIGVATTSEGIAWDGILGIGPEGLTLDTLENKLEETIPTVTDYLFEQGTIFQPVVGIFFQPITTDVVNHGSLTFGGPDPAMYTGSIGYTDITTTFPSSNYWGINQIITYGPTEILRYTAGIVDSATTFLYIASDGYRNYRAATGGVVNPANGLLQISPDQYSVLYDLNFHIGERTYSLIPNAQIWPRSLNHKVHGANNDIYLVVKRLRPRTGTGHDFLNGYVFLQRFYTVLDTRNSRVGFALTWFTHATTN
ncbi:aspartic peptidase domain-containing protein [Suillus spraguei]|nr:aspartic peptidase domain-containing protein [Suillus spraguei]